MPRVFLQMAVTSTTNYINRPRNSKSIDMAANTTAPAILVLAAPTAANLDSVSSDFFSLCLSCFLCYKTKSVTWT